MPESLPTNSSSSSPLKWGNTLTASSGFCSYTKARCQPRIPSWPPLLYTCLGQAPEALNLHATGLTPGTIIHWQWAHLGEDCASTEKDKDSQNHSTASEPTVGPGPCCLPWPPPLCICLKLVSATTQANAAGSFRQVGVYYQLWSPSLPALVPICYIWRSHMSKWGTQQSCSHCIQSGNWVGREHYHHSSSLAGGKYSE